MKTRSLAVSAICCAFLSLSAAHAFAETVVVHTPLGSFSYEQPPPLTPEEQAIADAEALARQQALQAAEDAMWARMEAVSASTQPLTVALASQHNNDVTTMIAARDQRSQAYYATETLRAQGEAADATLWGWETQFEDSNGNLFGLVDVAHNGMPTYVTTFNEAAAATIATDAILPGGSSGLALTGETQLIFQWDGGRVEDLHPEFADGANTRVFNLDFEILDEVTHATQVAGVMSAAGIEPGVRGMAPESSLFAYDLLGNTQTESEGPEIRQAADLQGMQLSNHSYGVRRGWEAIVSVFRTIVLPVEGSPGAQATLTPGNYWAWGGNIDLDPNHSHHFGLYNARSEEVDANAYDFPYHLGVWSAGNQHAKSDPLGGQGLYVTFNDQGALVSNLPRPNNGATRGGYETISDQNLAKNILSVGAVDDILGGYTGVGSVQNVDATFSSRGPTDDGRIKPDIMANGWELYSTDLEGINYSNATGTSFSSPSVTGSIALLKEHHLTLLAEVVDGVQGEIDPTLYRPLLSSSLRALVCHTADEAGSHAGPDYRFGWGLMNSERAAHVISDNFVSGMHQSIKEVRLNEDGDVVLSAVALGSEPLKITIAWTDPAGVPPGDVADNRAPMLVNDLDLRVSDGVSVTFPWVLDVENPSFAASRGDNVVDNIEQVLIPNPVPGLRYEITISHKGDLADGFQWVSIVMTGHELDRVDLHVEELALDVSGDLSMLWTSVVGQMYQVQTSSDNSLSPSSWVDLGAPISANREELSVPLDVEPSDTRRFFRVIEVETEFF